MSGLSEEELDQLHDELVLCRGTGESPWKKNFPNVKELRSWRDVPAMLWRAVYLCEKDQVYFKYPEVSTAADYC